MLITHIYVCSHFVIYCKNYLIELKIITEKVHICLWATPSLILKKVANQYTDP